MDAIRGDETIVSVRNFRFASALLFTTHPVNPYRISRNLNTDMMAFEVISGNSVVRVWIVYFKSGFLFSVIFRSWTETFLK